MDPQRLDRLLRIAVAFGIGLPAAPYLFDFPHDRRYCFDIRVGNEIVMNASLLFLGVALVARASTFSWMAPSARRWLVPRIFGIGALWFVLPFSASYGRHLLEALG